MFAAFGDNRLDRVDSTTPALRLAEWKASEKTRKAYSELFSNHDLLSKIGYGVFKQCSIARMFFRSVIFF